MTDTSASPAENGDRAGSDGRRTAKKVLTELRTTLDQLAERVVESTAKGARQVGVGAEHLARRLAEDGTVVAPATGDDDGPPLRGEDGADTAAPRAEGATVYPAAESDTATPRAEGDTVYPAAEADAADLRASLAAAGTGIGHAARAAAERLRKEAPAALEGARAAGAHAIQGAKATGRRIATAAGETKRRLDERLADRELAQRAAQAGHNARLATGSAWGKVRQATARGAGRAREGWERRDATLAALERRALRLKDDLAQRMRQTKERGVDFFQAHREEILALVVTAGKVAIVIGLRRLTAPPDPVSEDASEDPARRRLREKNRRLVDAATLLIALTREVGKLFAQHPSALPLLREAYAKGDESQQTVVGMLLGPSLQSDPEHGVEVIREFLESAAGTPAADSIARRSLAPLLEERPALVEKVLPWVNATRPLVKRAALIALERFLSDRRSRVGDIVAASVVILEDHDEEVRQALRWLLETASRVDREATARTLVAGRDRAALDALLPDLPVELQEEVGAARGDGAVGSPKA